MDMEYNIELLGNGFTYKANINSQSVTSKRFSEFGTYFFKKATCSNPSLRCRA